MTKNVIVSNNKLVTEDGAAVPSDGFVNVNALATQLAGTTIRSYQGVYDASGNTFPATGGSGAAGAIAKGDTFLISVAGTLGTVAVVAGDEIIAEQDVPGQTAANWGILSHAIGYVPAVAPETWVNVTGGIGFQNSWANFGSGLETARYRKRGTDIDIEGLIAGGADGTVCFTLPAGYRPALAKERITVSFGGLNRIEIGADGTVTMHNISGNNGTYGGVDCTFSTL